MPEFNQNLTPDSADPEALRSADAILPVDPEKDTAEVAVGRGGLPGWLLDFAAQATETTPAPVIQEENLREILFAELQAEDLEAPPADPKQDSAWVSEDTNPTLIHAAVFDASGQENLIKEALETGEPHTAAPSNSPEVLTGELRKLLEAGKYAEAVDLAKGSLDTQEHVDAFRKTMRPYLLLDEKRAPLWQLYDNLKTE